MKNQIILIICILFVTSQSFSQITVDEYLESITIEKLKNHIDTLASETMEGRNTGEYGQKLAAQYIANEFSKYGLTPINPDSLNPYYQKFDLYKYQTGEMELFYNGRKYKAPVFLSNKELSDSITSAIVFAGYGNQNDLENLDIENKSIFFFSKSVKSAIKKAKSISDSHEINTFIVGIPFGKGFDQELYNAKLTDFKSFTELYYYCSYYLTKYRTGNDFNIILKNNKVLPNLKIDYPKDIRIIFVPEKIAPGLFYKNFKDLEKLSKSNHKTTQNDLLAINQAYFTYKVDYNAEIDTIKTENVIGYIDSKLSDETIIIGGHYDHVGRNYRNEINYGADDNASGTTGVLTIAELLSKINKEQVQFKKDIVFIAYSAEELGLLGSKNYVQNPVFPLSKTDVLFNLDMIGRDKDDDPMNSNRVFLLKWKGGAKYIRKVKKLNNDYTHLIVDKNPGIYNRIRWTFGSDHYSFRQENISCVTYFTALHDDYHTPGDTPGKINYNKMHRIVKLVFLNVLVIATKK